MLKSLIISLSFLTSIAFAQDEMIHAEEITYTNNYKLREDRKVGVGLGVGGALGGMGGLIELNVEEDDSTLAGFGTGSGYQTVSLAWKRSFEGEYFTPYTTLGYAHWWSSGSSGDTGKSALLKNFLKNSEKESNNFGLNLVTGSFGMQFNQLTGEFAGSSFYIEFGGLLAVDRSELMPTGSVGAFYYF